MPNLQTEIYRAFWIARNNL